ncbi:hypothetical protein R1flu_007134 [Riccia fluitans]|uniref:Uncharacterized protein n=1 Tax=Riccia fluitans TaxID=41844 RepID=A0ABD1YY91_9MARC
MARPGNYKHLEGSLEGIVEQRWPPPSKTSDIEGTAHGVFHWGKSECHESFDRAVPMLPQGNQNDGEPLLGSR